ncbi:serine/arginine-rich splicing factor 2-like [Camelus dromedarius]
MSYSRPPPNVDAMISLKVDNLTDRISPNILRRIFEKYGPIGDVYIPRDRFTKESRGFAFVRFLNKRHAEEAMDALDGMVLDGRKLRVQMAHYRRPPDLHHGLSRVTPPYRLEHQSCSPRLRHRSRSNTRSQSRSHGQSRLSHSKSPFRSHDRSPSTSTSRSTRSSKSKSSSGSGSSSVTTPRSKSRSPPLERQSNS